MKKRIKVLRGHTAKARFMSEVKFAVDEIERDNTIPSPYVSSPTDVVHFWIEKGVNVIVREVRHARYEVFAV